MNAARDGLFSAKNSYPPPISAANYEWNNFKTQITTHKVDMDCGLGFFNDIMPISMHMQ